ncbi:MAG TPA: DUF2231 domain-containing protein, partial [Gemmatimonadaceae bacterium]
MPNLGPFHPQIVHFVVVLMLVGVAFRLISLTGKFKFTDHAAAALLIGAFFAAWVAVQSGTDAHGPVERIPGARAAVQAHEEDAKEAKNIFFGVALIEAIALGLAWRGGAMTRYVKLAHYASAAVGLWASAAVYEAADEGGALVYSYAGGPGLRTGKPEDVEHLLMAGLYNQSRNDRKNGKLADAADLNAEMAKRFPGDTTVQFLMVESLLLDSKDPKAALAAINKITVGEKDNRWRNRQAGLKADVFLALGQ